MQKQLNRFKYRFVKLFRSHQSFVVVIVVLTLLTITMLRINSLSNIPLDQTYLDTKTNEIKTVRFDRRAIEKIENLKDSNVTTPGTELPSNRQNPFNE